jgi:hypothetical protein
MQTTTALLADAATVSNGKLFVHGGGITHLGAKKFPVRHPTLALVLVFRVEWTETSEEHPLEISLEDEDGKQRFSGKGKITVGRPPGLAAGSAQFVPYTQTFNGIVFDRPGRFVFRVRWGDTELAELPLSVTESPKAS